MPKRRRKFPSQTIIVRVGKRKKKKKKKKDKLLMNLRGLIGRNGSPPF